MLIIPAIDILDKKVARLYQGKEEKPFFYSTTPVQMVEKFKSLGIKLVHIVDLDGALKNTPQFSVLEEIAQNTDIEFFWAGGLRTRERILKVLDLGAKKVVVSSLIKDLKKFTEIICGIEEKVIVSLDVKGNEVYIKGWKKPLEVSFKDLVLELKRLKIKEFIMTDIERDGTLKGLDIEKAKRLLKNFQGDFYIAGGISRKEDILALKKELKDLKGVIIGRAIYEQKIDLKELIEIC